MPVAELRITDATTGTEDVVGDGQFSDAEVSRIVEVADGDIDRGDVGVSVLAPSVLGASSKPLPPGRHRALLTLDGSVIVDGTVSNEQTSVGPPYVLPAAGTRDWGLVVRETAAEEAVRVGDVVGALPAGVEVSVEAAVSTGFGTEPTTAVVYRLAGLVRAGMEAAGLVVAALPPTFGGYDVAVGSPAAEPSSYKGLFGWTVADLWDAWVAAQRLARSAEYAPYPSRDVVVTGRAAHWVEPTPEQAAALPQIDALVDGWRWTTEPAVDEGKPMSDLALVYSGGPDGSWVEGAVRVPDVATYAAPFWRLGQPERGYRPAQDRRVYERGLRTVQNERTLELGWRLGQVAAGVDQDGATVHGPALYDVTDEGEGIYLWSLHTTAGGDVRAVAYRDVAGLPTHELWARELYARLALEAGDIDVVRGIEVLRSQVLDADGAEYEPALLDPARGIGLEGRAWAARSVEVREGRTLVVELVRPPAAQLVVAEGPESGGGGGGGVNPAPIVSAGPYDQSAEQIPFDWFVATAAPTPDSVEVELYVSTEVAQEYEATESGRSGGLLVQTASYDNHAILRYRARSVYAGTPTGWAEATREIVRSSGGGGGGGGGSTVFDPEG